jgi:chorismate--pyruvate lyase
MSHWRSRLPASRALAAWLSAPGSLSAQLASAFGSLRVQRLYQGRGRAGRDEAAALGLAVGQRVHVREVILRCDGRALVSARTVVEPAALEGPWRALTGLGSRSLAELLFHDTGVRRSPLAYARIRLTDARGRRLMASWRRATLEDWPAPHAWARHAVYLRRGRPLLVTEVFSPAVQEALPRPMRAPHGDRTRLAPAHASPSRPRREPPATAQ